MITKRLTIGATDDDDDAGDDEVGTNNDDVAVFIRA